ncbi:hypothetical protein EWM64_g1194 [Hericium alpestre]|uniref:Uncharacterized protein n=1 Tax=Hericium alpestre TaxID=135208 RepID=A0A4Z0A702_9AGAM|nr:hypothetical protein EWM64_g1194 [Hericium alpestre]
MNSAHRSHGDNRAAVYEGQLVEADKVSLSTNSLAFFFTFIMLWGFVTLPGTYAELQTAEIQNNSERRIVKIILQIPLPGFFNGLTGLATTLAGVYGARSGLWTTTEQVAALATGIAMLVFGSLMIKRYYTLKKIRDAAKSNQVPNFQSYTPLPH